MPHQYFICTCQTHRVAPAFAAAPGAGPDEAYQPRRPDSLTERVSCCRDRYSVHAPSIIPSIPDRGTWCLGDGTGLGMVRIDLPPPLSWAPPQPTTTWQASRMLHCWRGRKILDLKGFPSLPAKRLFGSLHTPICSPCQPDGLFFGCLV